MLGTNLSVEVGIWLFTPYKLMIVRMIRSASIWGYLNFSLTAAEQEFGLSTQSGKRIPRLLTKLYSKWSDTLRQEYS